MIKSIVIVLMITLGMMFFVVSVSGQGNTDYENFNTLKQLIELQTGEYFLVDVRTKEEYDSGHIPTAINIPYDIITDNLPTENRSANIILYCRSGNRSGRAYKSLEALGYTNLTDFGGIGGWQGELVKPE